MSTDNKNNDQTTGPSAVQDKILALADSERGKRNVQEATESARESVQRFRKAKRLDLNLMQRCSAR
jgi:hypothetical protein